jgi:hypothetical protein
MFEEQIAQGEHMIRRLEAELKLSPTERDALPSWRRVPVKETLAWQKTIEDKIRAAFGPDTLDRYNLVHDLYRDELDRHEGDEYSRLLATWHRILDLLRELDSRRSAGPAGVE